MSDTAVVWAAGWLFGGGSRDDAAPTPPDASDADAHLIARVRRADPTDARDAFGTIFTHFAPRLLAYARAQLGSAAAADDVVQDLFLSIWARRREWIVRGSLLTYLFQSLRHRIYNARRDAAVRDADVLPDTLNVPQSPEQILDAHELHAIVDHAVAALPARAQEAYRLVKGAGLSHAEAARVMGVTPDAIVGHLRRAVHGLQEAIRAAYGDA